MTHDADKPPHTRRRQDGQTNRLQRNLDWGSLASDIELFEQSPLLLADALSTKGSELKLTPVGASGSDATVDPDQPDNVTSIQTIKSRKAETDQYNLLTRYDADGLREQCKQVSIQHALVKKQGEQRLYLAVGMLHWVSDEEQDVEFRSPLLFYPTQLINQENLQSESGFVHAITNDSEHPEFNYQLTSELRARFGITLPVFKASQSLAEFLEQIETCISTVNGLRLELHVALGLCKSPAGITAGDDGDGLVVGRLPIEFDARLAAQLIRKQDIESLRSTLRLLKASNERELHGEEPQDDVMTAPDINEVREFSVLLEQHGLGKVRFQDLPDLPEQIHEWIDCVEPITQSELVTSCLAADTIDAVPLMKLAGLVELFDKDPINLEPFVHADLAYRGTPLLFKRAKYQARLIEEELAQLREHFHLERVPPKHQLLQLLDELSGVEGNTIEVVDSEYFHARRRFMELSIEKPTTLTELHRRHLNKLVKVLRFRELFVNNSEYRLALGPAYRGLKTDWDALEGIINYAQEISTFTANEALAADILGDWRHFREVYFAHLDELQVAGRALHGLLQIDTPHNPQISVNELLEHGRVLAGKLQKWNLEYGLITNYGDKTPATLLSIFSGKSKQDKATEVQVRAANRQLQQYLIKNQDAGALHRINATISWLNDAASGDTASVAAIQEVVQSAVTGEEHSEVTS